MVFKKWFRKKNDTDGPLSVEDLRKDVAEYQQHLKYKQEIVEIIFNYINNKILENATTHNKNKMVLTERSVQYMLWDKGRSYPLSSDEFITNILNKYKDVGYRILFDPDSFDPDINGDLVVFICWEPSTNLQFYEDMGKNGFKELNELKRGK